MLHNFHCSYQNSQEIKHWKMILKKKNAFDRSVSQTPLLAAHVICVLLYVRLPGVQPRAAAAEGVAMLPEGVALPTSPFWKPQQRLSPCTCSSSLVTAV